MERSEIMIPVFDGEDYSMWKQSITMFLRHKECEIVTTRVKTETDSEDWDKRDLKAMNMSEMKEHRSLPFGAVGRPP